MSKNNDLTMVKKCTEILETKEIFTLNLDGFSDIDDFDDSKGLLWNFRHYLSNSDNNISSLLGVQKDDVYDLCKYDLKGERLNEILGKIETYLKQSNIIDAL